MDRLRELLQSDLSTSPVLPLGLDDPEPEILQGPEPAIPAFEPHHQPVVSIAAEPTRTPQESTTCWNDHETHRNPLGVPSHAEDSDAGCVPQFVSLNVEETPDLTADHAFVETSKGEAVPELSLLRGELAPPGLNFCSILALSRFPYKHIDKGQSRACCRLLLQRR